MQATEFKKVLGNDITDLESAISDLEVDQVREMYKEVLGPRHSAVLGFVRMVYHL